MLGQQKHVRTIETWDGSTSAQDLRSVFPSGVLDTLINLTEQKEEEKAIKQLEQALKYTLLNDAETLDSHPGLYREHPHEFKVGSLQDKPNMSRTGKTYRAHDANNSFPEQT